MADRPRISIVTPIYNEEGNIPLLYERIKSVMDDSGTTWELVTVNDGSRDNSLALLTELASHDERVKVVNFARNFGHQLAVTAGMDYTNGEAVVLMDADLQDPPEVILDMIERWEAGYDVVYAVRAERRGESLFKRLTARLFYRSIQRITNIDIPLDTGDFRLMDAKVVAILRKMGEHNRFIRGMTSWIGFKQTGVQYVRDARHAGETKYPLSKMIRLGWDAVTSFSFFPLQLMIYASFMMGSLAILTIPIVTVLRLTQGEDFFGGQATTIVLVLLIGSFQMFFMFVLGQYVARIYDETRGRPLYIVDFTAGFEESTDTTKQRGESGNATIVMPDSALEDGRT